MLSQSHRAVLCFLSPQRASAEHLEWLKTVKESHGSVELSSLSLAAAINSRGVYVLRTPADGQKVRLLGSPPFLQAAKLAVRRCQKCAVALLPLCTVPLWGLLPPKCSPCWAWHCLRSRTSVPVSADNLLSGRFLWTTSCTSPSQGALGILRHHGNILWQSSANCRTN